MKIRMCYQELLSDPYIFNAFKLATPKLKGTVLDDMFSCIGAELERQGAFNEKLQASIFIALCETFGGSALYIPSGDRIKDVLSSIKIFKEFTGDNAGALAIKYRVSERTIHIICERQRKLQKQTRDHLENIGVRND